MALPALPTAENELGSVVDGVDFVDAATFNALRRMIEALALTSPRGIGDATNGIWVDPANQRIEFRGTARPTEEMPLPFYSDVSGTSGGSFGGGLESTNFIFGSNLAAGATRGVKTYGFTVPRWMDVTTTIDVVGHVQLSTMQIGCSVVFDVLLDIARPAPTPPNAVTEYSQIANVIALNPENSGDILKMTFGTLPANTLHVGDHVALTVQRNGANPSDTYSYPVFLSRTLALSAKRRYL